VKNAIVSIIIGDNYRQFWQQHCEQSWRLFAKRHDYDVLIIDHPIIDSTKSIHWQKLLILEHDLVKKYDRVVWLDSDILINPTKAPSIITEVLDNNFIGAVAYGDLQPANLVHVARERWVQAFTERGTQAQFAREYWESYYKRADLQADANVRFNTGVLVLTPSLHHKFLRSVFEKYPNNAADWEQTYLNYELVKNNLYHIVDPRFNTQVGDELLKYYPFLFFLDDEAPAQLKNPLFTTMAQLCLLALYDNNYFIHYCGARWHAPLLTEALTAFSERNFRTLVRSLKKFDVVGFAQ
jgi:lipopolysaccharide biosynthesis glycosyltransferase